MIFLVSQLLLLPLLDELRFCSQNALRKCVLLFEFPALKALVVMVRGIIANGVTGPLFVVESNVAFNRIPDCYNRQQDYSNRLAEAKQRQSDLSMELQIATRKYEELRDSLGDADSATIAAKATMDAYQQEYAQATDEVTKLSGQQDALKRSTQNAADAVSTAQTQLNRRQGWMGVRQVQQNRIIDHNTCPVALFL